MGGTDAASFEFTASTRQITTKTGVTYNYEATKNTYTVTASDGTDSGTITVTIDVTDVAEQPLKPAKPTLSAVSGSSTSLTATWTEPGLNGGPAITGYDLQYREGTAGTWEDFTHSGTGITTTITGLTAGTGYQVQVRAKNGETDSDWSDPSDAVSTNADTPAAPAITLVAVTSTPATSDTYGWGETIEISVTFNEAVDATPATDFELNVGGGGSDDRSARLLSGSGSETLVFGYTVVSSDEDDNGIWIGDQDRTLVGNRRISPQTGTITSEATSTEADLTHAQLGTQSGHKVDGSLNEPSAPAITAVAVTSTPRLTSSGGSEPDDTYGAGERIDVTVTFSEPVTATSVTDFVLNVSDDKRAPLVRGSGTATLVFGYTVVSSDADDNGIWIGDQDRTLVGDRMGLTQNGEITSEATGAAADLTHDALGTLPGHKVDGWRTNKPPVFNEGNSATRAVASGSGVGTEVGGPVLATDPDQDELTYSLEERERGLFGITRSGAQIIVGPNLDSFNSHEVTVNADDGRGGSDTIAVTIDFTSPGDDPPENRRPTVSVTPTVAVVSPGGEVVLTAVANDPDGDPLEYEWTVSPASAGMFDATDGPTATWTAPDSQGSLVLITVTVVDDEGETASAMAEVEVTDELTVRVTAVPDPPEVEPGGQVMLRAVVLDPGNPDGSGLTYMWSSEGGEFVGPTNQETATWTAPSEPGGSFRILVTVMNAANQTEMADLTVTVGASPPPPPRPQPPQPPPPPSTEPPTVSVTPSAKTVSAGGEVMLTATARDPDGGSVTYAWSSPSGSFDATDGASATWTAPPEPGAVEIRVTVTDDEGDTASAAVTVTVTVAGPPSVTSVKSAAPSVSPGGEVMLTVDAHDPDGGELTYAWSASSGSFDATDKATVTWTAPPQPGEVEIRVTVTDDEGETTSATVTVTVAAAGTPTVTATAEPAMVAPGGAVVLTAAGTDPDGGELTYAWSASSGSFDATDGATVTWTAPPEPGEVEIRVTATDDEGETASAAVTVTVTVAVAGTPTVTATAEPAMVAPGGAVVLTAAGTDPDGGELTYAWSASSGSFDATDGATVTWTAPPEPGEVEIRVTATDDEGETASAAVTVTVLEPVPALPGLAALLLGGLLLIGGARSRRRRTA